MEKEFQTLEKLSGQMLQNILMELLLSFYVEHFFI